jgi:hypothetical protein
MVSSFHVNIADFSKRIIELRPSLHPSAGQACQTGFVVTCD